MLMIPIIVLCIVIGIKFSLMTQGIFLLFLFGLMVSLCKKDDLRDMFVAGMIAWILMLAIVGIGIGDIYYYNTYYNGNETIWSILSWLWKP
jgi:Mn2+/Fe2+ NRAMP family transporter